MKMTYMKWLANMSEGKPNTYINKEEQCPFCDRETLRKEGHIIDETEHFMIVKNKFPVLDNTFSTIIVEHPTCGEHIGTYSIDYLTKLLEYSLNYYDELQYSGQYTSIVFFKNHGLMAAGSIKHPHMQIMGFKNKTFHDNLQKSDFEGIPILSDQTVEWNVSTKPRSEFYEINIILHDKERLDVFAGCLQKTVNYTLEVLNPKYKSYNLAFNIKEKSLKVKVIPRQPSTILLLGYGIHQIPDNLEDIARQLKEY